MPFYKFICKDCGEQMEIMASMEEKQSMKSEKFVCSKCGSKNLEYTLDFAGYSTGGSTKTPPCGGGGCPSGTCPFV